MSPIIMTELYKHVSHIDSFNKIHNFKIKTVLKLVLQRHCTKDDQLKNSFTKVQLYVQYVNKLTH